MQKQTAYYQSEIGIVEIVAAESTICAINFVDEMPQTQEEPSPLLQQCLAQLDAYFSGKEIEFDLPLRFEGTPFQNTVWQELTQIPPGEVISYAQLAQRVGNAGAYRAVGNANGKNPLSIVVPCHRVIGSNGKLTGYGGGLWRKKWLLAHEGVEVSG